MQFMAGEVKVFSSALETGESEESVPANIRARILKLVSMRSTCLISCAPFRRTTLSFGLKDQKSAGELQPSG